MSEAPRSPAERVAAMRGAFDRSFATPRPPDPPPDDDLLAIRVEAEPYALRLSEIGAVHLDRRITPLPGSTPVLRGIAGFRGVIAPIYDLAALLGRPPAEVVRWLVIAAGEPIGFAFAAVDGRLRIARDAMVPNRVGERPHRCVREFARITGDVVQPIIDLPSMIDAVKRLAAPPPQGERR
jgi:chemotaxis signal transduction protein